MSYLSDTALEAEPLFRPVELLKHDKVIRDTLTTRQLDYVDAKSRIFEPESPFRAKRLSLALVATLLDLKQFRFCGRSFLFKLNTILKCFKKGSWQPPVYLPSSCAHTEPGLSIQRKIHEIDAERLGLILAIKDNERLVRFHDVQKTGLAHHYRARIQEYTLQVTRLEAVSLQLETKLSTLKRKLP